MEKVVAAAAVGCDRLIENGAHGRTAAMVMLVLAVSGFACTKPRSTDLGDGGPDHPGTSDGGPGSKDAKDGGAPDMTTPRDGSPDMNDGSPVDPGCVPNATQCDGMQPQTCDANRKWQNTGSACAVMCSGGLCTGGCTADSTRCNNLQPQVCDATGAWKDMGAACPNACSDGVCTGSCAPNAVKCNGLQPQKCDATGTWQNMGTACPFVCNATTGACTGTCTPTAKQCMNLQPQVCDATGTWANMGAACPSVCNGGTCTACTAGAKQCNGLQPQTCDTNGMWQNAGTACPYVCNNTTGACTGSCVPDSLKCSTLQPQKCDATGTWQNMGTACPFVCSAGVCGGSCVPDSVKCNGLQPQKCDATGTYQNNGTVCGACAVCVTATGMCAAATNGTTCTDNNACTVGDTCQSGACTPGPTTTCTAGTCKVAGTCNTTTGVCSTPTNATDGTTCSDGDGCTQTDKCMSGSCVGSNPVVCPAAATCKVAGTCQPSTGTCSAPTNAANGTNCSDGNMCTQTDTCQSGSCVGSNPVVCPAAAACKVAGTCQPSTGTCSAPTNAANGTSCNDGNACTQTDTCQSGTCTGSNPVVCPTPALCHTAGTCQPSTGTCTTPNATNGTSCNDSNACTSNDSCQNGTCTGTGPDTQNDKNNCGTCGTVCDTYQYCRLGKCGPTYEWTRVLPVTPLDALSQIHGAAVTSAGDIVVQVDLQVGATSATVTFNNASEASSQVSTTYSTCAMGRISTTNHLVWGTDLASSFMNGSAYNTAISFSQVALLANDDLVVSGVDAITSPTPVTTTNVLTRLPGAAPYSRTWAITYGERPLTIFPRPSRGDYITIGAGPNDFFFNNSNVIRAVESTLTATTITQNIYNAMALALDKTTMWMVGGCYGQSALNGPTKLNPWSATTTDLTGGRSFIVGAKDDGTNIGPWLTTNAGTRPANLARIMVDANGDLIVVAGGGGRGDTGAVSLNGKEILAAADNAAVFKVAASNGNVAWKAAFPSNAFVPAAIAPDGAVILVAPNSSTYSLTMYRNTDGSVPVAFTGSGVAQAVVSGTKSLYVLGTVSGSADFNPGTKSDIQGTLPGIFVTRFSY